MRRMIAAMLTLCMLLVCLPAQAQEMQKIVCSSFSVELPAVWTTDVDEFTDASFPFLKHIYHPVMIWGSSEDYELLITLYCYEKEMRYRLGAERHQSQAFFDVLCESNGLSADGQKPVHKQVQSLRDSRMFTLAQLLENEYLAAYYSKVGDCGYTFSLKAKKETISQEEAGYLLLVLISSLREDGVFYPEDATGKRVVISHASAHIRAAADVNSDKLLTAYQGDSFDHYGEDGSWYIINVNGQTGYVSKSLTELQ